MWQPFIIEHYKPFILGCWLSLSIKNIKLYKVVVDKKIMFLKRNLTSITYFAKNFTTVLLFWYPNLANLRSNTPVGSHDYYGGHVIFQSAVDKWETFDI